MAEDLLVFQVRGRLGPMTLAFRPLGRHPFAAAEVTDLQACELSLEEVQEWYTYRGWPARGRLQTCTRRGYYKGLFEMVG